MNGINWQLLCFYVFIGALVIYRAYSVLARRKDHRKNVLQGPPIRIVHAAHNARTPGLIQQKAHGA